MPVRQRSQKERAVTPIRIFTEKDKIEILMEGGAKTQTQVFVEALGKSMDKFQGTEDGPTGIAKLKNIMEQLSLLQGNLTNLAPRANTLNKPTYTDLLPFRNKLDLFFQNLLVFLPKAQPSSMSYEQTKTILQAIRSDLNKAGVKNQEPFQRFYDILKTITTITKPSEQESTKEAGPTIETFDTTLDGFLSKIKNFDTPNAIKSWFEKDDKKNYFIYLYGIGKILKTKQELLQKNATSLREQIEKVNSEYDDGIAEIKNVVPPLPPKHPDVKLKENLLGKIVSDVNDSFKTQFNELLQKKIRYDETIEKIKNRRAYLVYWLNQPDNGFNQIVNEKILKLAEDIYGYYRGARYTNIRNMIFSYIIICAYNPEIVEKSFMLNTSITGPAGSGKTTLARKLANWFSAVGFLTSDSYLEDDNLSYREVGAPELIAPFVGQTAPKTLGVLYSTLERCLFIDEAYSVAGCSFDTKGELQPSPYGEDFLSVLLPFMANHQGIGCLVVAGYKNLMEKCFFARNEGLPRRFPTRIDLPLYTTDELYDMFLNANIVKRQVASIRRYDSKGEIDKDATNEAKKQFRRAKQIIYLGIKPAFLMFHYDTSFNAFDLLRKYLLLYQNRQQQFLTDPSEKNIIPTHSYTITNHVLTCLLSNQLRRNIIRYYFYKKVFEFQAQNLSWFPAQAGEMGLVADMANKKIEVHMNEMKRNGIRQNFISIEQEVDVFDTYFDNKPVRLIYFREVGKEPIYTELIKRGYESEKKQFQKKIQGILIDNVLNPSGGEFELPPLQTLWKLLFNDLNLLPRLIGAYVTIAKEVIPELLKITEDKFPVNMIKSEVENELTLIQFYEANPSASGLLKSEIESFTNFRARYASPKPVNLKHHYIRSIGLSDPEYPKKLADANWEDFAFKDKD